MKKILLGLFLSLFFQNICFADICTGLLDWWAINEGSGASSTDAGSNLVNASWVGSPSWTASAGAIYSNYLGFNGSTQAGNSASTINLSAYNLITVTFWLYQIGSGADQLAMEFSSNYNSNTGGFIIDMNSGGASTVLFGAKGNVDYVFNQFAVPSRNTWHHYALVMSSKQESLGVAYVDGVSQSLTSGGHGNSTGAFGTYTLYFMSRNASSLWNQGRLQDVRIYNRALSQSDVTQLFAYTSGNCSSHFDIIQGGSTIRGGSVLN